MRPVLSSVLTAVPMALNAGEPLPTPRSFAQKKPFRALKESHGFCPKVSSMLLAH